MAHRLKPMPMTNDEIDALCALDAEGPWGAEDEEYAVREAENYKLIIKSCGTLVPDTGEDPVSSWYWRRPRVHTSGPVLRDRSEPLLTSTDPLLFERCEDARARVIREEETRRRIEKIADEIARRERVEEICSQNYVRIHAVVAARKKEKDAQVRERAIALAASALNCLNWTPSPGAKFVTASHLFPDIYEVEEYREIERPDPGHKGEKYVIFGDGQHAARLEQCIGI